MPEMKRDDLGRQLSCEQKDNNKEMKRGCTLECDHTLTLVQQANSFLSFLETSHELFLLRLTAKYCCKQLLCLFKPF